jgi:hypothetical protein
MTDELKKMLEDITPLVAVKVLCLVITDGDYKQEMKDIANKLRHVIESALPPEPQQ